MDIYNNVAESPENYAEWQKRISQGYILHDAINITFFKWQNSRNGDQNSVCHGLGMWVIGWEKDGYD